MTETRRLYLGKCIEDLDKLHNIPDLKYKRALLLCKTAKKLFDSAEEARESGDEESSYVFYMKYLRVVAFVSKDKEYQQDKIYYNNMLGTKNPNKALDAAEKLKISLIDRYAKLQKDKRLSDIKESELFKQKIEESRKKAMEVVPVIEPPTLGVPGPDEVTITSEQLYGILKAGKLKVLIMDARPAEDFLESHIEHQEVISVPEEAISPGQSANVLEQALPLASRRGWGLRAAAQLIVLLDRRGAEPIPGDKLYLLKTILLKWDVKVQYARAPLALRGGYDDWLLKYPAACSNPRPAPKPAPAHDALAAVHYPPWGEGERDERTERTERTERAERAERSERAEPAVDRASKAAALSLYAERARLSGVLEQQQRLADSSLTLEMQRLEAEQDWEKVRTQKETEEQEELRAMYKLREQEIISQLMQLENKQFDMEQENQSLRALLEEYQRREKEEAARLAAAVAAQDADAERARVAREQAAAEREVAARRARIAQVTAERSALSAARAALEQAREQELRRRPAADSDSDSDSAWAEAGLARAEPDRPAVDRSTKPAPERPRDFQPVRGDVERGLTGLKNLGNTCYMNSIIQCLSNTSALVSYFCSGQYLEHINRSHVTRGAVAEELAAAVRALWSGQYRFIAARDLRLEVGKQHRAFRGQEQQDSHEFLTILMDWLHLDLQRSAPPAPAATPAEKAWRDFTRSQDSLVLQLFYGQTRSSVRCTVCQETSLTYEGFSNLSLELPASAARCSLADCLRLYLGGETVPGWNCPACKQKRDAVKKLDISRLPPVLVIHFKRFYLDAREHGCSAYRKKQTYIEFPLEELDLRAFAPSAPKYRLYAVSNHYGAMEGGHYTAYCRHGARWLRFDDHLVGEVAPQDVQSSAAYIVFYAAAHD